MSVYQGDPHFLSLTSAKSRAHAIVPNSCLRVGADPPQDLFSAVPLTVTQPFIWHWLQEDWMGGGRAWTSRQTVLLPEQTEMSVLMWRSRAAR